ncbi:hypothetical protein BJ742DRAFT_798046 [Cladochytrium replicatum]|nr:hypothetical protein BJ742DRAFT_798046 [Cladochytrium replicatum]
MNLNVDVLNIVFSFLCPGTCTELLFNEEIKDGSWDARDGFVNLAGGGIGFNPSVIADCTLVCKSWRVVAERYLWRSLCITTENQAKRLSWTLFSESESSYQIDLGGEKSGWVRPCAFGDAAPLHIENRRKYLTTLIRDIAITTPDKEVQLLVAKLLFLPKKLQSFSYISTSRGSILSPLSAAVQWICSTPTVCKMVILNTSEIMSMPIASDWDISSRKDGIKALRISDASIDENTSLFTRTNGSLQCLHLDNVRFSLNGIQNLLYEWRNLRTLHLIDVDCLTLPYTIPTHSLTELRELVVGFKQSGPARESLLALLSGASQLTSLGLIGAMEFTDEMLSSLAGSKPSVRYQDIPICAPNLKQLQLRSCTNICGANPPDLTFWLHLQVLDLSECNQVQPSWIRRALEAAHNMDVLILSHCGDSISNEFLEIALPQIPNRITRFSLRGCYRLVWDGRSIQNLLSARLPFLKHLDISSNSAIGIEDIRALFDQLTVLRYVWIAWGQDVIWYELKKLFGTSPRPQRSDTLAVPSTLSRTRTVRRSLNGRGWKLQSGTTRRDEQLKDGFTRWMETRKFGWTVRIERGALHFQ